MEADGAVGPGAMGRGLREVVLQMHMTLDGFADSREGFVPVRTRYGDSLEESPGARFRPDADQETTPRGHRLAASES